MSVDKAKIWGSVTDTTSRLGSSQRLAERVASSVAADMNVDDFQVVVSTADSPAGMAYTTPSERHIEVSISTVECPDPRVLRATLAHELAHVRLGVPWWERYLVLARFLAPAVGAAVGVLVAHILAVVVADAHTNVLLLQAVCAAFGAGVFAPLLGLLQRHLVMRLELNCDAEAAHHIGDDWMALVSLDPAAGLSAVDRFLSSDHPSTSARAETIRLHANRQRCGCPVEQP